MSELHSDHPQPCHQQSHGCINRDRHCDCVKTQCLLRLMTADQLEQSRLYRQVCRQRVNGDVAAIDSMRNIMCFLNIKACEDFLVDILNKKYEPEDEHNMGPLKIRGES